MTISYDEDEHDEGSIGEFDGTLKSSKRRSRSTPVTAKSYRSTISKRGIPTTVALKGGVRGGHSVATMTPQHPTPLGLSPGDYASTGDSHRRGSSVHSMVNLQHWPKGLTNVGNTCYANAALQCLLSTALTSALLDPKTVPILRRYSSNPNLLAMGSGSVDSSDEDDSDNDGCGLSIDNDLDEEEDGIFMDSKGVVLSKSFSPSHHGMNEKPPKAQKKKDSSKLKKKKKKEAKLAKAENAAKRKERERRRMEETCKWLTTELTSIAQEYMEDSGTSIRQSPVNGSRITGGGSSIVGWLSSSYNQTFGVYQAQTHGVVNPGSITRHPNRLSQCLNPYQQEDAHEFMRALLSNLVMNGHNRKLSSLFDGLLESSVTCQTCGRASLTRDRYMDLSVDINDVDITTLDDALFEFTKDELLTDDNQVYCQRCRQKRTVTKGLRLATAPSILVIHLKRFAFNDYGRLVRLHKRIKFPPKLEIGDYMSNLNKARPPPYSLVGVLVHQGQTCASGHYLSYVKKNGEWFKCNDSEVSVVDESTVMMQQAYILMYEVSGMRENSCFKPKPFRKESSIMSTIESLDDATMAKEDFSVCGTHWSASDKSSSKRSSCYLDGKGSYNNPYGSEPAARKTRNESTTEHLMRVLRQSGVTRLINDICCDSVSFGINDPNTDDKVHDSNGNFNYNHAMLLRNSGKYAHECESVDTQDSYIRRQSLMSSKAPNPINVLEVQRKRKPSGATRSQTAPRQRGEKNTFHMVTPYSTFTPRAEGTSHGNGTEDGVMYRKFKSNGNLKDLESHDLESVTSRSTLTSTLTRQSRDTLQSRERHTFSSTRSRNEDFHLQPPPRKSEKSRAQRRRRKSSKK